MITPQRDQNYMMMKRIRRNRTRMRRKRRKKDRELPFRRKKRKRKRTVTNNQRSKRVEVMLLTLFMMMNNTVKYVEKNKADDWIVVAMSVSDGIIIGVLGSRGFPCNSGIVKHEKSNKYL